MSVKILRPSLQNRVWMSTVSPRMEGTYAAFLTECALRDARCLTASYEDEDAYDDDRNWEYFNPCHFIDIYKGNAKEILEYAAKQCGTSVDNVYLDPIDNINQPMHWAEVKE